MAFWNALIDGLAVCGFAGGFILVEVAVIEWAAAKRRERGF